ncbi:hypothetical protein OJ997_22905 [Solirubrobacter phytolaccae]|uniref:Uncharacterized protein n=1 Tax=Solirubrobacter phytolaccae TaxID=1404360 RepID=A0A9X3NB31_9ACTN|nr:hypothetical protein [Solirubrobacter phytolaccae]MDA0183178.1 hypothetical protein [Solirubrobacter phytolaccae]
MPESTPDPDPALEADLRLAAKVDDIEGSLINTGGTVLGSAIGLASIAAGIAGPETAIAGALVGVIAGFAIPRLRRWRKPAA